MTPAHIPEHGGGAVVPVSAAHEHFVNKLPPSCVRRRPTGVTKPRSIRFEMFSTRRNGRFDADAFTFTGILQNVLVQTFCKDTLVVAAVP